jgi:hypothetical protein
MIDTKHLRELLKTLGSLSYDGNGFLLSSVFAHDAGMTISGDFMDYERDAFGKAVVAAVNALPALLDELDKLRAYRAKLRTFADEQANDDGLWFVAETASEAYLQAGLRKLTRLIEDGLV